jgi:hypothetical protein
MSLPPGNMFRWLEPDNLEYHPLCDDFRPMDMSLVVHFIEQLRDEIEFYPEATLIYNLGSDRRSLANNMFLLGAYLIIMLRKQLFWRSLTKWAARLSKLCSLLVAIPAL